ncbi:hypothetical protein HMPREF1248_1071 [Coriobacteriaceae bacterium BV3Ac1]|nr:hypothetical protein HMPREF1248_1071 [Coriobacteriaceae bacterium BV3Ac1]
MYVSRHVLRLSLYRYLDTFCLSSSCKLKVYSQEHFATQHAYLQANFTNKRAIPAIIA